MAAGVPQVTVTAAEINAIVNGYTVPGSTAPKL
jgi:hypothetical protein